MSTISERDRNFSCIIMTRTASLRAREEDGITTYHREKPFYADCLSGVWHLLHMQKEAERDYRPTRKINVFPCSVYLVRKRRFYLPSDIEISTEMYYLGKISIQKNLRTSVEFGFIQNTCNTLILAINVDNLLLCYKVYWFDLCVDDNSHLSLFVYGG